MLCDQHRRYALERVEQQGQRRRRIVSGPQDVRGADTAGTDLAHIAGAERVAEDQPERHRSKQVANQQR
jgi:hypothetical protein